MITQFLIDGTAYNVQVMSLTRSFEVKDAIQASETQGGSIYRNPVGTYYNYSMTVREKDGDRASFDAFWEAISKPVSSHVCVFPYNQTRLTQRMYVTAGTQAIGRLYQDGAQWNDITVQFIAQAPKVLA
jgi:hypothetical protein